MSQIEVLTVKYSVRANLPKPGLSNRTSRLPFVTRLAIPLTMNDIASVVISALMRKVVVIRPLASPTSNPAPMPSAIAIAGFVCKAKCAEVTAASEYVAPTERSMRSEERRVGEEGGERGRRGEVRG